MIDEVLRELTNEDPNCQAWHDMLLFFFLFPNL